MNKGGRFVAELVVHNTEPRQWTQKEITLVEETAEHTWAAVERARAEKVLWESEGRLKVTEAVDIERRRFFDVLETLPVMVCLLTADCHVVFANRAFREKFGESEGRNCYEYCFGSYKPCEFCESYKVLETGKPHHWEAACPDGSVVDVYDFPFSDIDGSPMILEMDIDITERRRAEESLAKIETARKKEITTELRITYRLSPPCLIYRLRNSTIKSASRIWKFWKLLEKAKIVSSPWL